MHEWISIYLDMVTWILLDHHNVVYDNEHDIVYIRDRVAVRKHYNMDDYMFHIVLAYDIEQQRNYDLCIRLFRLYDDLDPWRRRNQIKSEMNFFVSVLVIESLNST